MNADNRNNTIVRLLKRSRYLTDIAAEKIRQLAAAAVMVDLSKGEVLLRQDEVNRDVYIIITGSVSIHIDSEFIYSLSRAGDILGEMSVITGGPSNATIMADNDVRLIRIPSDRLKKIHGNSGHALHSALYQWFSSILTDKLYKTSQKAKQFERINRHLQSDLADAKSTQDRIFSSHTHPIEKFPLTLKCEFSNILGGDFYAVYPVGDGCYGILIGDVSGHGTGACLISMMILNLFMAFSPGNTSPGAVIAEINRLSMQFMHQGKFVTLFYAVYDPGTRRLSYTTAGHHPALVLRKKDIMVLPATPGIPIGVFDNTPSLYEENTFFMAPRDRLLLFTDAVFEAHPDSSGEDWGLVGLADYLSDSWAKPSARLVEDIYQIRVMASRGTLSDDFTLMVFDQM